MFLLRFDEAFKKSNHRGLLKAIQPSFTWRSSLLIRRQKKSFDALDVRVDLDFFKMNFWDGWMDPISMSYREDGWRMETWCKLSWSNIDTSTAALRIYTCFTLSTFSSGAQGLKGPRLGRLVAFFNFWATCRSTCRWLQWQIVDQRPVTMMRSMMQWLSQSMSE